VRRLESIPEIYIALKLTTVAEYVHQNRCTDTHTYVVHNKLHKFEEPIWREKSVSVVLCIINIFRDMKLNLLSQLY